MPRYDYTTVGHVTADVLADGSRRAGGGAFYSALQAARLGQRTLVITQGVRGEIEQLLEPYRGEFELHIRPAPQTTTLQSVAHGPAPRQRVLAHAGPIEPPVAVDTTILHVAPVARETGPSWRGSASFVGLTAQGLVRTWSGAGGEIGHVPLAPEQLPERCGAIVISRDESESCAWLIAAVRDAGAGGAHAAASLGGAPAASTILAVTAGSDATALYAPGAPALEIDVPPIESFVDDVGAGDVFAASLFVALKEGCSPREAAAFANAAAAVRIAARGPGAVGRREEIEARVRGLG